MISVNVKTLSGDLIQIDHRPSHGFSQFVRKVYDAFPDIPFGCLTLHRVIQDNYDDDEKDEINQLMNLSDLFLDKDVDYNNKVTYVLDDDMLMTFVDTSLVFPVIFPITGYFSVKSVSGRETPVSKFKIRFCCRYDDDKDKEIEDYKYTLEFDILFINRKNKKRFALAETLESSTPQECAFYHGHKLPEIYKETSETMWFPSIIECLEKERIPRDQNTIVLISEAFSRGDWKE